MRARSVTKDLGLGRHTHYTPFSDDLSECMDTGKKLIKAARESEIPYLD